MTYSFPLIFCILWTGQKHPGKDPWGSDKTHCKNSLLMRLALDEKLERGEKEREDNAVCTEVRGWGWNLFSDCTASGGDLCLAKKSEISAKSLSESSDVFNFYSPPISSHPALLFLPHSSPQEAPCIWLNSTVQKFCSRFALCHVEKIRRLDGLASRLCSALALWRAGFSIPA